VGLTGSDRCDYAVVFLCVERRSLHPQVIARPYEQEIDGRKVAYDFRPKHKLTV
jgi:hypothetical protein